MKLQSFLILFFTCVIGSNAQQLVQNKAEVNFKIKNLGMYVYGSFSKVAITGSFSSENLDESYINATIKVNSINTKNTKRDKHLLSDDYFDATNYKEIKLKTTKIEKVSESKYKLIAKLTIKETTKRIVIPLQINEDEESITIRSNLNINRRDYKVGGSSWILSNTVKIEIIYIAKK